MAVQRKMEELIASIPANNRWKVDKEIDFENTDIRGRTIPQHVGRIAAEMTNWEQNSISKQYLNSHLTCKCHYGSILYVVVT